MVTQIKSIIAHVVTDQEFSVEPTPDPKFGHYATNLAMRMAKGAGKSPLEVASELKEKILAADKGETFERIEVAPPGFLNFWISEAALRREFMRIVKAGAKWGKPEKSQTRKKKRTVVIDYSHPNIAKPMSVGHLRSTIIGQALYNIFTFRGWKTIGDNHLGDWGKQFGVLIAAYKEQLTTKNLKLTTKKIVIDDLLKLYVDYTARMKADATLEDVARRETKKLQDGDRENVKIWKAFYKVSIAEFQKIYKILGVRFDYYLGESFYQPMLEGIVKDALERGIAERSEGAIIIPIPNRAPLIIQKKDDAFLYATTDIAAVRFRIKKFRADMLLYVVGNEQNLYFEQLFYALEKLGIVHGQKLVHASFGLVHGEDMKRLSTRAGRHIHLDRVIEEAIRKAEAIVKARRPDIPKKERDAIAKAVGVGAIKYNDLSQNRESNIQFAWDKMLNFEGNSAPYLMYTYTRLKSILRKEKPGRFVKESLTEKSDIDLVLLLIQFPDVLEKVTETLFPHLLADYLYELAKAANHFYHEEPVLKAEPRLKSLRLHLVSAVSKTLHIGLGLLGIDAVERM